MCVEESMPWVIQVEWNVVYFLPPPIPNPKMPLGCLSKTKVFIACHPFECKRYNFQKRALFTIQLKQRKPDLTGTVWMLEGGLELEPRK